MSRRKGLRVTRQPNSLDFLKGCGRAVLDSYEEDLDMGTVLKRSIFRVAAGLRTHIDQAEAEEETAKPHTGENLDDRSTVVGTGEEI